MGFNPYLEIRDCKFIENVAVKGVGGAIKYVNFIFSFVPYALIMENVEFTRNIGS